ncbi:hypothetical protein ANCCEY_11260 [Ancylostoma ceylanicum]|uniref:Uncharacterized protein n=1 Tax=Ancylostoma ceylanicum TaxID=53326 RepID=A0A0D6LEM1_9BILA|nr:hypothetical protein ANCCEY_11260 [Ancylostoma ceylanicum]
MSIPSSGRLFEERRYWLALFLVVAVVVSIAIAKTHRNGDDTFHFEPLTEEQLRYVNGERLVEKNAIVDNIEANNSDSSRRLLWLWEQYDMFHRGRIPQSRRVRLRSELGCKEPHEGRLAYVSSELAFLTRGPCFGKVTEAAKVEGHKVPESSIAYISESLQSGRTAHSTVMSSSRKFLEQRLRSSPYLMEMIVRLFYHDYTLLGYPLPNLDMADSQKPMQWWSTR